MRASLRVLVDESSIEATFSCLDPREENGNSNNVVELCLPVANAVKVCILIWIVQQSFKEISNNNSSVNVKCHGSVAEQKHNNIKNIPETFEVFKFMFLDFDNLFNSIVNKE